MKFRKKKSWNFVKSSKLKNCFQFLFHVLGLVMNMNLSTEKKRKKRKLKIFNTELNKSLFHNQFQVNQFNFIGIFSLNILFDYGY